MFLPFQLGMDLRSTFCQQEQTSNEEDEVAKASEVIKREMESAASMDVPLVVEVGVGDNWMDAK